MVPTLSVVFMAITLLICLALPIGGLIWLITRRTADGAKRYPRVVRAFLCGVLAFVASQMLIRIPLMTLVIPQLGESWRWLVSGPVASFTAGLFEETGRLVVMLLLMRLFHRWADGVSFGFGHGGIEAILITGVATLNNLVLAVMINTGQWGAIASQLPPDQAELFHSRMVDTAPVDFLMAGVERLAAVSVHIGLSVLILWGVHRGRKAMAWVIAVIAHGLTNLLAVSMMAAGAPMLAVEGALLVCAVGYWVWIVRARRLFPAEIHAKPHPDAAAAPRPA